MGLMDKLKGLLKGREKEVKGGIDTASNEVEKRVGPEHAAKVDNVSDKAKEAVDKLSGAEDVPAAATPPDVAPENPPRAAPPA